MLLLDAPRWNAGFGPCTFANTEPFDSPLDASGPRARSRAPGRPAVARWWSAPRFPTGPTRWPPAICWARSRASWSTARPTGRSPGRWWRAPGPSSGASGLTGPAGRRRGRHRDRCRRPLRDLGARAAALRARRCACAGSPSSSIRRGTSAGAAIADFPRGRPAPGLQPAEQPRPPREVAGGPVARAARGVPGRRGGGPHRAAPRGAGGGAGARGATAGHRCRRDAATAGTAALLDATPLLSEDEVRGVTGYVGEFEVGRLTDLPRTEFYDSRHFKARGQPESFDVALRVWRLPTAGAEAQFRKLLSELPGATAGHRGRRRLAARAGRGRPGHGLPAARAGGGGVPQLRHRSVCRAGAGPAAGQAGREPRPRAASPRAAPHRPATPAGAAEVMKKPENALAGDRCWRPAWRRRAGCGLGPGHHAGRAHPARAGRLHLPQGAVAPAGPAAGGLRASGAAFAAAGRGNPAAAVVPAHGARPGGRLPARRRRHGGGVGLGHRRRRAGRDAARARAKSLSSIPAAAAGSTTDRDLAGPVHALRLALGEGGSLRGLATGTVFDLTGKPSLQLGQGAGQRPGAGRLPGTAGPGGVGARSDRPRGRARASVDGAGRRSWQRSRTRASRPTCATTSGAALLRGDGGGDEDQASTFQRFVADHYGRIGVPAPKQAVARPTFDSYFCCRRRTGTGRPHAAPVLLRRHACPRMFRWTRPRTTQGRASTRPGPRWSIRGPRWAAGAAEAGSPSTCGSRAGGPWATNGCPVGCVSSSTRASTPTRPRRCCPRWPGTRRA